jgi:hypothetical protein
MYAYEIRPHPDKAPPVGRVLRILLGLVLMIYVVPVYFRVPARVAVASLLLMLGLIGVCSLIHIAVSRQIVQAAILRKEEEDGRPSTPISAGAASLPTEATPRLRENYVIAPVAGKKIRSRARSLLIVDDNLRCSPARLDLCAYFPQTGSKRVNLLLLARNGRFLFLVLAVLFEECRQSRSECELSFEVSCLFFRF